MFWPDVIDLKLFYASRLGRVAQTILAGHIRRIWQNMQGEAILGIGFTPPFLEAVEDEAERVLALMPAGQGALRWLRKDRNITFLGDEAEIPLPDASINRVLLVHAMENSEQLRPMLHEISRVLTPNGRLLAVVPNRGGVWARVSGSPFAHGSPFSASQLKAVLRDNGFAHSDATYALFVPPTQNELILRSYAIQEWIGKRFFTAFGGIILMEGEKQIYALRKQPVPSKERNKTYIPAPQPVLTRLPS